MKFVCTCFSKTWYISKWREQYMTLRCRQTFEQNQELLCCYGWYSLCMHGTQRSHSRRKCALLEAFNVSGRLFVTFSSNEWRAELLYVLEKKMSLQIARQLPSCILIYSSETDPWKSRASSSILFAREAVTNWAIHVYTSISIFRIVTEHRHSWSDEMSQYLQGRREGGWHPHPSSKPAGPSMSSLLYGVVNKSIKYPAYALGSPQWNFLLQLENVQA